MKNRKLYYLLITATVLLASCSQDDYPVTDTGPGTQGGISFRLKPESFDAEPSTRATEEYISGYDRVEYYIMDPGGEPVRGIKTKWESGSSSIIAEGLCDGDYVLYVLGIRGDYQEDGAEISTLDRSSDTWISFPEHTDKPLTAEYFYSKTPFTVSGGTMQRDGEIFQKHIIGGSVFTFSYSNPFVRTAVESRSLSIDESVSFYRTFSADSTYSGESKAAVRDYGFEEGAFLTFMPTVEGSSFSGEIRVDSRSYSESGINRKYRFSGGNIVPNRKDAIQTAVTHPDDNLGSLFVTQKAYAENNPMLILQDNEHKSVYTTKSLRSFHTTKPLQVEIVNNSQLHVRFYSPRPLRNVTILCRFPGIGEKVELAKFDEIPAFGDIHIPFARIGKNAMFRTASGKYVSVPELKHADLAALDSFEIVSDDEYWEKLQKIKVDFNVYFSLYGGDPEREDGKPVGNWMGIRPVHCREAVALLLNISYMWSLDEVEQLLKDNPGTMTDNNRKPVAPETALAQMRSSRDLQVGLVYPGHGTIGLGGGNVYGLYQKSWLEHYTNAYACRTAFHELGHCLGYSHNSSFTYGAWAESLMNNWYVNHISDFPINSASYLNSKQNPDIY